MSLIQEALRRRDEESGGGDPGRIPPRVVLPVGDVAQSVQRPSPDRSEPEKKSHIWASLVLLLAVGLIVAVAVFAWFFYRVAPFIDSAKTTLLGTEPPQPIEEPAGPGPASPAPPGGVVGSRQETIETSPSGEHVAAPSAAAETPPGAHAPSSRAVSPVGSAAQSVRGGKSDFVSGGAGGAEAIAQAKSIAPGEQAVVSPQLVSAETTMAARVGGKPAAIGEVKTVPVAVAVRTSAWPRLTLNGVMAQTGPGQGSAIINGAVVEIGEKIEGARLVEVQRNGVLLEFKGATQFVRVGQSTY